MSRQRFLRNVAWVLLLGSLALAIIPGAEQPTTNVDLGIVAALLLFWIADDLR